MFMKRCVQNCKCQSCRLAFLWLQMQDLEQKQTRWCVTRVVWFYYNQIVNFSWSSLCSPRVMFGYRSTLSLCNTAIPGFLYSLAAIVVLNFQTFHRRAAFLHSSFQSKFLVNVVCLTSRSIASFHSRTLPKCCCCEWLSRFPCSNFGDKTTSI